MSQKLNAQIQTSSYNFENAQPGDIWSTDAVNSYIKEFGKLPPNGAMASEHFAWSELFDPRKGLPPRDVVQSYGRLANNLEVYRHSLGDRSITITSGFRSSAYNTSIGGATNSWHTRGAAVDITVQGMTPRQVQDHLNSIHNGGLEYAPTWTHIDTGANRRFDDKNRSVTNTYNQGARDQAVNGYANRTNRANQNQNNQRGSGGGGSSVTGGAAPAQSTHPNAETPSLAEDRVKHNPPPTHNNPSNESQHEQYVKEQFKGSSTRDDQLEEILKVSIQNREQIGKAAETLGKGLSNLAGKAKDAWGGMFHKPSGTLLKGSAEVKDFYHPATEQVNYNVTARVMNQEGKPVGLEGVLDLSGTSHPPATSKPFAREKPFSTPNELSKAA
ncbi:MAG TPA: D-Ala-D-Ala carboxypeptidase family metallohydrolase [Candidatus Gastranaerophilales bacterium]|nr:D-Ala-D-Ala carboxypeptidase family metallohydrolase [Candidatus Gastranaerophilales bacterium]